MRLTLLLTAFGLFLGGNTAADEARIAPDWTLQSESGASLTLSEVAAEQPVIVLFWAAELRKSLDLVLSERAE